jgi:hypothetical protein
MSNTYTATAGDTWAGIAFRLWAEETLMWKLIEANPLRAQTVIFEGGEVLKVPDIEETDNKAEMPPWRR